MSFRRPNTALVERKEGSTVSQTGEPVTTPTTVHAALPCRIDPLPVGSRTGGSLEYTVEGVVYMATDVLFADGMMPARFPSGWSPGDTFAIGGVTYTIAANGRGAFPDLKPNDRVTDESSQTYLILAIAAYSDVLPNVQARCIRGRAW